jgi:Anti-sigma-K factor rskA
MIRPHDELEPLIAADALDGLDQADHDRMTQLMAEHGADCIECRRLTTEYREVAGAIALVVDPVPMSAGAEDALIRAAAGGVGEGPVAQSVVARRRIGPARRWVAAVAVAAGLAVLGGVIGYNLAPGPAGIRTLALTGQAQGQLTLVYQPGRREARLVGAGLADPGAGKVYELWYQPSPNAKMVPAGVFTPSNGSVQGAPVRVGPAFDLVAVTIEPGPEGSPQPTQQPILAATP